MRRGDCVLLTTRRTLLKTNACKRGEVFSKGNELPVTGGVQVRPQRLFSWHL